MRDRGARSNDSAAGDHRNPPARRLDRERDQAVMLGAGRESRPRRSCRTGRAPSLPSSICHSTRSRNAASSTRPAANGVTSAGIDPKNIIFSFTWIKSRAIEFALGWFVQHTDKDGGGMMSSMRRMACLRTAPPRHRGDRFDAAGRRRRPRRNAPPYAAPVQASDNVGYAIADWRRLRAEQRLFLRHLCPLPRANPGWPGESAMRRAAEKAMRQRRKPARR